METYYSSFDRGVQVAMAGTYGELRKAYGLASDTYGSDNNNIEFLRALSMLKTLKSLQTSSKSVRTTTTTAVQQRR